MQAEADHIATLGELLAATPIDKAALAELDRRALHEEDPERRLAYLDARVAAVPPDGERASLALELTTLLMTAPQGAELAQAWLMTQAEAMPAQPLLWERLARLQLGSKQFVSALHSLQRSIQLMDEGAVRRDRQVDLARVAATQADDLPLALKLLRSVLELDPRHPTAQALLGELCLSMTAGPSRAALYELLAQVYRITGAHRPLAELLAAFFADAELQAAQLPQVVELAELYAGPLAEPPTAFTWFLRAFALDPFAEGLADKVFAAAAAVAGWEQLAAAYAQACAVPPLSHDPGRSRTRAQIRRALAEVLDQRLGRGSAAIPYYYEAVDAAAGGEAAAGAYANGNALPSDEKAQQALARLLREADDPSGLAPVLRACLRQLPEGGRERLKLLQELADLYAGPLAAPTRAIEALREVVRLAPRDAKAWRSLAQLQAQAGAPEDALQAVERLVELGQGQPTWRADALRLARLQQASGRPDEAFRSLRQLLQRHPEDAEARASLEPLIDVLAEPSEAYALLEPLIVAAQDWEKLAWLLERRVQATTAPVAQRPLLRRLGDVYEKRLQQPERALAVALRNFTLEPQDVGGRLWLERLAGAVQGQGELAAAYAEAASGCAPPLALQLRRRAAALYHEELGDPAAAAAQLRAILAVDPRDERSALLLCTLLEQLRDLDGLEEALGLRLRLLSAAPRRAELALKLAQLQRDGLQRPEAAVDTLHALLQEQPEQPEAARLLEEILRAQGDLAAVATLLAGQLAQLQKHGAVAVLQRQALQFRLASLLQSELGDAAQAAPLWAALLGAGHVEAQAAVEARAAVGDLGALDLRIAAATAAGDAAIAAQQLTRKFAALDDPVDRRAVALQLADLYEGPLQAPSAAVQALCTAFCQDGSDLAALQRLATLAAAHHLEQNVLTALGPLHQQPLLPAAQQALGHVLAAAHLRLQQQPAARQIYADLLQRDPCDVQALACLQPLLLQADDWAGYERVVQQRLAQAPQLIGPLLHELASQALQRGEQQVARDALLRLVAHDADDLRAWEALWPLLDGSDDALARLDNLDQQLRLNDDPAAQLQLWADKGELLASELDDNEAALMAWQQVLRLDPKHAEAAAAAQLLLASDERWEELAELLRRRLGVVEEGPAAQSLRQQLGTILGDKLGRTAGAAEAWQQILAREPDHVEALEGLLGLQAEAAQWPLFFATAERLLPLLTPAAAIDLRLRLISTLMAQPQRPNGHEQALSLAAAVRDAPTASVAQLAALAGMLRRLEAFAEEASVHAAAAAAAQRQGDAVAMLRHLRAQVEVLDVHLHDPAATEAPLLALFDADPAAPLTFAALCALPAVAQNPSLWAQLHQRHLPHVPAAEQLPLWVSLRDTLLEKLQEPTLGFLAACHAYQAAPQEPLHFEIMRQVAQAHDLVDECLEVLRTTLPQLPDAASQAASLRQQAQLHAELQTDWPAAVAALQQALALQPQDVSTLQQLVQVHAQRGDAAAQMAALEQLVDAQTEVAQQVATLRQMADLAPQASADPAAAAAPLRALLALAPDDVAACERLFACYCATSDHAAALATLRQRLTLTTQAADKVALHLRGAALCVEEMEDVDAAVGWCREALAVAETPALQEAALAQLNSLLRGSEDPTDLATVLQQRLALVAALAPPLAHHLALLAEMVALCEGPLQQPTAALDYLDAWVALQPDALLPLRQQAELLRQGEDRAALLASLRRRLTLPLEAEERVATLLEVGGIEHAHTGRVDAAEEAYLEVLKYAPEQAAALQGLAQLYERSGNWYAALDILARWAAAVPQQRVATQLRIAHIHRAYLGDLAASARALDAALAHDPRALEVLLQRRELAAATGDASAAGVFLGRAAATAADAPTQVDLWLELGRALQQRDPQPKDGPAAALEAYENAAAAFAGWPAELPAPSRHKELELQRALGALRFEQRRFAAAAPCYARLLEVQQEAGDVAAQAPTAYRLAYCQEQQGALADALATYRRAYEADPTYLPALEGLAARLLAEKRHAEATTLFEEVLREQHDSLTRAEVIDLEWQLGELHVAQGHGTLARQHFLQLLARAPRHVPTLRALIPLAEAAEDWEQVYTHLGQLADALPSEAQPPVWSSMAQVAHERLGDVSRALQPLLRLQGLPQPPAALLRQLAQMHLAASQRQAGLAALQAAGAAAQKAGERDLRREILAQLGDVYAEDDGQTSLAVRAYHASLEEGPLLGEGAEGTRQLSAASHTTLAKLEALLAQRQEWGMLEASYRALLAGCATASAATREVFWRQLGGLYRRVLRQSAQAITAYEVLRTLRPQDPEVLAALSELYGERPDGRARAIELRHALLLRAEDPLPSLRHLQLLYQQVGNFDGVFVMAAALQALGKANAKERDLFTYLRPGVPSRATRGMGLGQWEQLAVPAVQGPVAQLAAAFCALAPSFVSVRPQALGLRRAERLDVQRSEVYMASLIRYTAHLLGVPALDLYRRRHGDAPLHLLNARPSALAVGENHPVLGDLPQPEVLFQLGALLCRGRAELFLPSHFEPAAMRHLLLGLLCVYNRTLTHDGDPKAVQRYAKALDKLPAEVLRRLQPLAQAAHHDLCDAVAFARYRAGVEIVALRAGLVAAGDLQGAMRACQSVEPPHAALAPADRIRHLVLFATSAAFLRLRHHTGAHFSASA